MHYRRPPVIIRWERTGVRLIPNPSYIAKNQTASSAPVEIFLQPISAHSSITEDKVWCPVRALKYYWHRTQSKRSGDQLFVITKEPFSPASRDTISKWIVAAIQAAGSEALAPGMVPHAHDTRAPLHKTFCQSFLRQKSGNSGKKKCFHCNLHRDLPEFFLWQKKVWQKVLCNGAQKCQYVVGTVQRGFS